MKRAFNGRLIVRVQSGKGKGASYYNNEVSLTDWKQLATIFSDLEIHGAKIDKAYIEYKRLKQDTWPF